MKTPIQELIDLVGYMDADDLYDYFMEKSTQMLEKEKDVIINAANNGCWVGGCCIDKPRDGEIYYNKTFNTKEK